MSQNNNSGVPSFTKDEPITPVAPSSSAGTVIEKGETQVEPVKPSSQPGSAMPFGEPKDNRNNK